LKIKLPVLFPPPFVALTPTTTPFIVAAVGIPLMTPVVAFKLNPNGNTPLATA
jgi:hypothetical protein